MEGMNSIQTRTLILYGIITRKKNGELRSFYSYSPNLRLNEIYKSLNDQISSFFLFLGILEALGWKRNS